MPAYLSEAQKASLVSNGTYKRDGTVNLDTAKALHWDAAWEADKRGAPPAKAVPSPARQQ